VTLIAAGISLIVLTPLAYAKRRHGAQMASQALQGDGTLSGTSAASSLLALTALVLNDTLGWWWAGRTAALVVAAIGRRGMAYRTTPVSQPVTEIQSPIGLRRYRWPQLALARSDSAGACFCN
jgi:hypothetical protein